MHIDSAHAYYNTGFLELRWMVSGPPTAINHLALIRFDEGLFAEVWFPAAELLFEEEGDAEDFVVFPWAADNLHAFRQPGGGAADANDGRGPAEQIEKGRVGIIEEA